MKKPKIPTLKPRIPLLGSPLEERKKRRPLREKQLRKTEPPTEPTVEVFFV